MAMDIVFPSNFRESQGDLLEAHVNVIAHQTNCTSVYVAGLAASIFHKHPGANGNVRNPRFDKYGTVELIPVTSSPYEYVANIYGQVHPGPPRDGADSAIMRLTAFEQALNSLVSKMYDKGLMSVAFPKLIGCDMAGGDWVKYRQRIRDIAVEVSDVVFQIVEKK